MMIAVFMEGEVSEFFIGDCLPKFLDVEVARLHISRAFGEVGIMVIAQGHAATSSCATFQMSSFSCKRLELFAAISKSHAA